jgi:hypothetical protein
MAIGISNGSEGEAFLLRLARKSGAGQKLGASLGDLEDGIRQGGWYRDPFGKAHERWWDGTGWTERVRGPSENTAASAHSTSTKDGLLPSLPDLAGATPGIAQEETGVSAALGEAQVRYSRQGRLPTTDAPYSNIASERQTLADRQISLRTLIAVAGVVLVCSLAAVAGTVAGRSGGPRLQDARHIGTVSGRAEGARAGGPSGYRAGYRLGFASGYRSAYAAAYRRSFEGASK